MKGWGPARLLATVFGLGRIPVAPGTFGSAAGLFVYVAALASLPVIWQAVAAVLITLAGTVAAERTRRQLAVADPSEVVVDELAGMCIALVGTDAPATWVVAFVLFRFFDVAKPFPVRQAEALRGGVGIMADDVAAGIYALLLTQAARLGGLLP